MKKYKSHKQYRLPTRTYAEEGAYFITICTKDREFFFGDIIDNQLNKNSITEIVEAHILELPNLWQDLMLDAWVIMPNHVHLLLVLGNINFTPVRSLFLGERVRNGLCPLIPNSISSIINHFKGKVTK